MATANPFDLLGDDDNDDPSQLIAVLQQKVVPKKTLIPAKATAQPAKLPTKPLPPTQAVREAKDEVGRGGGRGGGYGRPRGGGGYNRGNNENSSGSVGFSGSQGAPEDRNAEKLSERRGAYGGPRPFRGGGRRVSFSNGEAGDEERPRREFERRSGTGRGSDFKREGSGRGNWGTQTDEPVNVAEEVKEGEKTLSSEKPSGEEDVADGKKENSAIEAEEKEAEDKEMTLEEYEKVLEEKRKALQSLKTTEERKVDVKVFDSMQQLSSKKDGGDDVFIKLGSDKEKRKELAEKEEKTKKSVSINEFLKPAEGERYYNPGGRGGRGRGGGGRGSRGGSSSYGGGFSSTTSNVAAAAIAIEDPSQFPTLGAK